MTDELVSWCERHLGAPLVEGLFRRRHLSDVRGVLLADGCRVVVKIRPPSPRLDATAAIQRHLHAEGFPCPDVLAGPAPFGGDSATAESYVPPHGDPRDPVPAAPTAALLAQLIDSAPPPDAFAALDPPPPWVGCDHVSGALWPWPGPDWVDYTARRVRRRLADGNAGAVIGHVDSEAQNLDWGGDRPVVVHDWDSLAICPEATIAGVAAAVFPSDGRRAVAATLDETAAFLEAYSSHRHWTTSDDELAWCAGLWVLTYNARKESPGGGRGYLDNLASELADRCALARL